MAVPNPPAQAPQPTPPMRSDPVNFAARFEVWLTWFAAWTLFLTRAMDWVRDCLGDTQASAAAASDAATAAAISKNAAAGSATAASDAATAAAISKNAAAGSATAASDAATAAAISKNAAAGSATASAGSAKAASDSAAQAASSATAATQGGIRFDTAQTLTEAQKIQAQANLGGAATPLAQGLMSAADKQKLNGIAPGATLYAHPTNHPASVITQDVNNRFVSDAEKANWNAKMGAGAFGLGGAALPVTDFNSVAVTGFFMAVAATGAPSAGGWWMVQNIVHNSLWMAQTAWGFAGNEGQVMTRVKSNGTWTNWSGNMAGGIKSVQRGMWGGLGPTNVTIAAVNVAKATVRHLGGHGNPPMVPISLLSATQLQIHKSNDQTYAQVSWEVVEFF